MFENKLIRNAGDVIADAALAIEMGADAADIGLTIHPHPTLSETIGMAAESFEGTITDLYVPKKRRYSQAKRALIKRAMAAQFKTGDSK